MILIFLFLTIINYDFFESEQAKDFQTILSELEFLRNNPIDLNTAHLEELTRIPFLTIPDILRIIEYREKEGLFESITDLKKIKGFDRSLLNLIQPYITVRRKGVKLKGFQSRIRFQKEPGKDRSEEYYTKTTLFTSDSKIYLLTEKDPYESSPIDFYSAGILIDEGKRKFVLGNYNLDFGSGIMLSSTGSFFQSTDFRILSGERGILPYTSTIENGGFFGAALSDTLFLNYCLFYSHQKLDGAIDDSGYARSFDPSGSHIDSASNARKDRIKEEIFGYNISYSNDNIRLGNRTYWSNYEPAFVCSDSTKNFYGKKYQLHGLDIKYLSEKFIFFTEIGHSFQNKFAGVAGWSGLFPYNFDFNIAVKYFDRGYYAPKGVDSDNDYIGLYFDLKNHSLPVDAGTSINIYTDCDADTNNYDLRFNIKKLLSFFEVTTSFRWYYRNNIKKLSGSRISLRIMPENFLSFNVRCEEKYAYNDTLDRGIFGSIEIGVEKEFITGIVRYSLFETDSYSARIYTYEPDLPGIINNHLFYGEGRYGFLYFSLKPLKGIRTSFKYSFLKKESINIHLGAQIDLRL
uniref:Helix-hairpin-helix domain-containing protein n=1 Tax=candidate division WOR-3 bacterium TaxID=2052148 RepID=A0A7V3RH26_UNCW3